MDNTTAELLLEAEGRRCCLPTKPNWLTSRPLTCLSARMTTTPAASRWPPARAWPVPGLTPAQSPPCRASRTTTGARWWGLWCQWPTLRGTWWGEARWQTSLMNSRHSIFHQRPKWTLVQYLVFRNIIISSTLIRSKLCCVNLNGQWSAGYPLA